MIGKDAADRDLIPARQVRGREDHAGIAVQRSAAADPEGGRFYGRIFFQQHFRFGSKLFDAIIRIWEISSCEDRLFHGFDPAAIGFSQNCSTFCAADIKSEQPQFHYLFPPFRASMYRRDIPKVVSEQ